MLVDYTLIILLWTDELMIIIIIPYKLYIQVQQFYVHSLCACAVMKPLGYHVYIRAPPFLSHDSYLLSHAQSKLAVDSRLASVFL